MSFAGQSKDLKVPIFVFKKQSLITELTILAFVSRAKIDVGDMIL